MSKDVENFALLKFPSRYGVESATRARANSFYGVGGLLKGT